MLDLSVPKAGAEAVSDAYSSFGFGFDMAGVADRAIL